MGRLRSAVGDGSLDRVCRDTGIEPITRLAVERVLTQLVGLSVDINSHLAGGVPQAVGAFSDFVREIASWTSRQARE